MKKLLLISGFAIVSSIISPLSAHFEWPFSDGLDLDLSAGGRLGYESEYVFRGQKRAQGSLIGLASVGYGLYEGDVYLRAWGARPLKSAENFATEARFGGGFNYSITDIITLDLGGTYYWYPDRAGMSGLMNREKEIYAGIGVDVILNPELVVTWNFDREMLVIEAIMGHSFDLNALCMPNFYLEPAARFGFLSAKQFNGDQRSAAGEHENSYFYGELKADLIYQVRDFLSISVGPRFAANSDGSPASFTGLASNLSGANQLGNHDTMFWWGISVSASY